MALSTLSTLWRRFNRKRRRHGGFFETQEVMRRAVEREEAARPKPEAVSKPEPKAPDASIGKD